jgi:phosphatidylglycerophosphate synthase
MKEHLEESTSKYKDPANNEPFMDNYVFFPISDLLVTPLRNLGMTPNGVTVLSSLFQLYTIILISVDKIEYACVVYFIGYLLDCVDGNMARKYNMGSKYGMTLDMVSDVVLNIALILYIMHKKGLNSYVIALIVLSYMANTYCGINEALITHNTTQTDNFYAKKEKEFENEHYLLADMYLLIMKGIYNNYKFIFPTYNEEKLNKLIRILKEFGPGNFITVVIYVIYSNFKK